MSWYRNLRTAHKLLLECGLTTVLLAVVGVVGVLSMERMERNLTSIYQRDLTGLNAAQEAKLNQAFAARSVRSILLSKDNAEVKKHIEDVRKYAVEVQSNVGKAERILTGPQAKAELERTRELMTAWLKRNDQILQFAAAGNLREAMAVMTSANAATFDLRASLGKVCDVTQRSIDSGYRDSVDTFRKARLTMLVVSIISVIFSLGLGYFAARSISIPLARAAAVLREMGEGRLTAQVQFDSKDEIGLMAEALNGAILTLRSFLRTVSSLSLDMAGASRELAAASRNLANGVSQHAAGQEETTVTLEQLSLTVRQNANNAAQASGLASESQKKAEAGGGVVTAAVGAMDQVKVSSHKIAASSAPSTTSRSKRICWR